MQIPRHVRFIWLGQGLIVLAAAAAWSACYLV